MNIIEIKNNKLIIIITLLFMITILSFPVLADNGKGNSTDKKGPEYKVSPPVVVLKVTPASDFEDISQNMKLCSTVDDIETEDYLQKEMTVEWIGSNGKSKGDENGINDDLRFKIEDSLNLSNEKEKREFGLNSNKNSDNIIDPKYILVKKKKENNYSSLDEEVEVLDSDTEETELKFKLDEEIFEDNDWQDIEAGVYKGNITSNIGLPGNSNKRLRIIVIIDSVVNINIPDQMNLEIEKPIKDKSVTIDWSVNTNNSDIKIKFSSKGIELKDNKELDVEKDYIDYSNFFKYYIAKNESFTDEFSPGSNKKGIDYREGKLKLKYSAEENGDKEWYELLAGEYEDTVTITVSE